MTNCQHTNCTQPATHAIRVNIPAKGFAIDSHTPMRLTLGLELCLKHAKGFKVNDFLTDQFKQTVTDAARAQNRVDPDFKRAFITPILLTDPEYCVMKRHQAGRLQ